ncbi:hypothetical protein Pyrfu_0339 [Pyrolobus fumarii 1A]|uniref:Uncharacterized protein n=1 Tax=Pyrolobus fumarii (strain DSM 11204 / 1A) TaxID=694429 RepID=G0EFP0_PYRF1|nr:hypothetical protein [Pyrolobus fumarii]AEM38211.1 hypothetical protein Pyrfu_0339 [Pyrolobus fumarii 1A]
MGPAVGVFAEARLRERSTWWWRLLGEPRGLGLAVPVDRVTWSIGSLERVGWSREALLELTSRDDVLEAILPDARMLVERAAGLGFTLVTGPDLTLRTEDPCGPAHRLVEVNLEFCRVAEDAGLTCMPVVKPCRCTGAYLAYLEAGYDTVYYNASFDLREELGRVVRFTARLGKLGFRVMVRTSNPTAVGADGYILTSCVAGVRFGWSPLRGRTGKRGMEACAAALEDALALLPP